MWAYDDLVPPHFADAPAMVERRRSHERPDIHKLPAKADVAVELYGGASTRRALSSRNSALTRKRAMPS